MRALKLITLLVLALAAFLARPHLHNGPGKGGDAVCAKCQVRDNPVELGERPVALNVVPVSFAAPRVADSDAADAQPCLTRAPKQGPPAA